MQILICIYKLHKKRAKNTAQIYAISPNFLPKTSRGRHAHYWTHPSRNRLFRIRLFTSLIVQQLSIDSDIDLAIGYRVYFEHRFKSFPRIAFPMTSSIEPIEQHIYNSESESVKAWSVISNSVVMVITHKYLIQLPYDFLHR